MKIRNISVLRDSIAQHLYLKEYNCEVLIHPNGDWFIIDQRSQCLPKHKNVNYYNIKYFAPIKTVERLAQHFRYERYQYYTNRKLRQLIQE